MKPNNHFQNVLNSQVCEAIRKREAEQEYILAAERRARDDEAARLKAAKRRQGEIRHRIELIHEYRALRDQLDFLGGGV